VKLADRPIMHRCGGIGRTFFCFEMNFDEAHYTKPANDTSAAINK
jgi:hypothetical protein